MPPESVRVPNWLGTVVVLGALALVALLFGVVCYALVQVFRALEEPEERWKPTWKSRRSKNGTPRGE